MDNYLSGTVFWVTGLSGAGKTTIGNALYYRLKENYSNAVILDGDVLKKIVSANDLGYTDSKRRTRAYQYSSLCKTLSDQGLIVVICTIAMYDEVRLWNREHIDKYVEIFLDVPLDILIERDQKGLYSEYSKGNISDLAGMDLSVELPKNPDLTIINDGSMTVKEITDMILNTTFNFIDNYDRDSEYWNEFYSKNKVEMEPSPFAKYAVCMMKKGERLLELGCGNGRDSLYFADNGLTVTAIDAAEEAINNLNVNYKNDNINFICDDFVKSANLYQSQYDYIYSRFTIHAINEMQQRELLNNVFLSLKVGGKFFIEVRSIKDTLFGKGKKIGENTYFYNGHFRRFIVLKELVNELLNIGFVIEYSEENKGFAPYKDEDPIVIRIIASKLVEKNT